MLVVKWKDKPYGKGLQMRKYFIEKNLGSARVVRPFAEHSFDEVVDQGHYC